MNYSYYREVKRRSVVYSKCATRNDKVTSKSLSRKIHVKCLKLNATLSNCINSPIKQRKVNLPSNECYIRSSKSIITQEIKEIIIEQFAVLSHIEENQLKLNSTITQRSLLIHFNGIIKQKSYLLENIAEYILKTVPRFTLREFQKFIISHFIHSNHYIQKTICYSIYANSKDKICLSKIYDYLDDPISQIIINDLLSMITSLSKKLKTHEVEIIN